MPEYMLRLYVTGSTSNGNRAIANLRRICEEELEGRYDLEVIDILERPQLAEEEKIVATPLLKRELPRPVRHIIGDLSDVEKVLFGLDIVPVRGKNGRQSS